jgi:hypothetical protein
LAAPIARPAARACSRKISRGVQKEAACELESSGPAGSRGSTELRPRIAAPHVFKM